MPGVSRNDYESMQVRLLADTDRINLAYSERIKEVGHKNEFSFGLHGFIGSNLVLLKLVSSSSKTLFFCGLLFCLLMLTFLMDMRWYCKIEVLLTYAGAYLIMLYFAFIGRIPLRVFNSILYAVFGIMLVLYSSESLKRNRKAAKWLSWLIGVIVILVAAADTASYGFVKPQSVFQTRIGADESRWEKTYHGDDRYVWMTNEFVQRPMRDFIDQGKLMTDEFLEHNLCVGEWLYGQVYYDNYLERIGMPNPMRAFLDRENIYCVAEDNTMVLTYLQEHFDENVVAYQVDEIDGIPVWKFEKEDRKKKQEWM